MERQQRTCKAIVEEHDDGYIAYPLGFKGVVIGQGETRGEAIADLQSALRFHLETFGEEVIQDDSHLIDATAIDAVF